MYGKEHIPLPSLSIQLVGERGLSAGEEKCETKGKKVHESCLHGLGFVLGFGFLCFLFFLWVDKLIAYGIFFFTVENVGPERPDIL